MIKVRMKFDVITVRSNADTDWTGVLRQRSAGHRVQSKCRRRHPSVTTSRGDRERPDRFLSLLRSLKTSSAAAHRVLRSRKRLKNRPGLSRVLAAALALPPDGKVVGLDDCKEYVDIGRPFWKEAGVEHKIDIHIGNALEILDCAIADGQANTFDFVFIDADKKGYDDYYERCLQLVRRNGLIAFDNVLWDGKVYDAGDKSPDTAAIRRMNEKLQKDTRVDISMLTVGDGLTLALRK
ncbi:hypothetical protein HPB47_001515 [Ixodes persulcatus]|uniref:Uncharacterized protein n=1 Tax=Ixodes persulcatus TaxID=34615 RepID=A0AC60PNU2_IXOPE|nr:hypothetical protein HPB47_001515 [Ixodes persulcatus]